MKKFRWVNWGIVLVGLLMTLGFIALSPNQVVMHFNGTGTADSWSSCWGLLLEPAILAGLGLICDRVAVWQRKRSDMQAVPVVLFNEWRYLALMGLALIGFALLQLSQMGWLN